MTSERTLRLFAGASAVAFAAAMLLVGASDRRPPAPAGTPAELVALIRDERAACERAWPGYRPFERPLLLAFGADGSVLLGASRAPFGFMADDPRHPWAWTSRASYPPHFAFDLDFDMAGTTVTALRIRPPWNASREASIFFHERFHGYQAERFKDIPYRNYTVEDARDEALAAYESYSLGRWIYDHDAGAMRDFAALRLKRRALFPATAAEDFQERQEGTAKYVELAGLEVSSAPAARAFLLEALSRRTSAQDLHKLRAYAVGAVLCRWLQAQGAPGWRREIEEGRSPAELVLKRLALSPAEADRRVRALTAAPRYAGFVRDARRDLELLRTGRVRWRKSFDSLPGLRLVLTSSAAAAAFSGDWLDYPDGDSLLVASEWVVDRPEIHVRLRGDKGVWRDPKRGEAEFVVPPQAVITVDGAVWTPAPGRLPFHLLTIDDPRIALKAGPGVLDDDGTHARLSFPDAR